jgi:uncharacterized membrane protein YhaH (DUF805 family)
MAYDNNGQNLFLLKRALAHSFDFRGRSRRSELLFYSIAASLLSVIFAFALLPIATPLLLGAIRIVLLIPTVSLFARRLHDQDKGIVWMLPWVASVLMEALRLANQLGDGPIWRPSWPIQLAGIILGIITLVLALWPGTIGTNRFGPDPRLEEA